MKRKSLLALCYDLGIAMSNSRPHVCFDHATAESFWSIFKHEYFWRHTFFTDLDELRRGVAAYMDFYKPNVVIGRPGNLSPINCELLSMKAAQAA